MASQQNDKVTNVLIVGVGGQGVIMVSKVLALLCQSEGYEVKQSEVHGMAKRGGSVFSHVRFGNKVHSPTIPAGEADVLVALEWAEGLRWLDQLNPELGTFIADTHKIVPPFACRNRRNNQAPVYSQKTPKDIIDKVSQGYALDAVGMARELGNERAANTILLGIMSTAFDFDPQNWIDIISKFVPANSIEINRKAFLLGREWIKTATVPEVTLPGDVLAPAEEHTNELEIIPLWCKGCDICVRMCPEHCLELDEEQKAFMARPDNCTGCRICEWLCPDYAIKLHKVPVGTDLPDAAMAEA